MDGGDGAGEAFGGSVAIDSGAVRSDDGQGGSIALSGGVGADIRSAVLIRSDRETYRDSGAIDIKRWRVCKAREFER